MQNIPAMMIIRILNQIWGELGVSIQRISKGEKFVKEKPSAAVKSQRIDRYA
jgi:hypothetical protein